MFEPLVFNPAYAGSAVQLSATAVYRNQWVNLEGAPETITASAHSSFMQNKIGAGFMIANDKIGIHNDFALYTYYSYKINFPRGTLSMGLSAGFNNLRSNYELLNLKSVNDPNLSGVNSVLNPNFGVGFLYASENFFAGVSAPYLLNNDVVDIENVESLARQRRNYFITAGHYITFSDKVKMLPSTLIRFQEGAPLSLDVNANFIFYETVGLGVSWRNVEGFVGLFELKLNENFHLGYAYDITTSDLNQFSAGSHEIMLNYRIKVKGWHSDKLLCPSYF